MSAMEYSASVLKLIGDKYNLPDDVLDLIAHECGLEYVYAFRATVLKDLTQPHFVRSLRNLQEQRNSEAWRYRRQSAAHRRIRHGLRGGCTNARAGVGHGWLRFANPELQFTQLARDYYRDP